MAIPYEPKPLPAVTTVDFNVDRWAGVNKIKGSQADYEMSDCKNMSSDNFPYSSPRKAREKLLDEAGIQRIYKVEGDKVYYIDSDGYLCCGEGGLKNFVLNKEEKIKFENITCTNNYDMFSVFYPSMSYIDRDNEVKGIVHAITWGALVEEQNINEDDEFGDEVDGNYNNFTYASYTVNVESYNTKTAKIKMKLPEAKKYGLPQIESGLVIRFRFYDAEGDTKKFKDDSGVEQVKFDVPIAISDREQEFEAILPELDFEAGDYCLIRIGYFKEQGLGSANNRIANVKYVLKAEWEFVVSENAFPGPALDYGVVYNNRIVGVKGSDIRASALGDFTNFHEYVDEAGNPSATGAYATDVGSAGEFTGICSYNNVLLLFKRDIVYEMYGSMPYTLTELCNTGCIDNDSIASVDGVLYWASPKGIVRYSGGVPQVISTQIGIDTSGKCKAGTDGRKYYVFDGKMMYVYDTYHQMWHIEDDKNVNMFYNHINDLYGVYDDGIYKMNSGSESVEWEFETKDYTFGSKERKNLSKLWLRADMPKNSRLEVYVKQNGGEWVRSAVKTAERDEMFDFKLRVKKCDSFALKFKGKGDVRILDIHGKITVGTSKHRSGASLNVYRK